MPTKRWDSLTEMANAMTKTMQSYEATGTKPWSASTALVDLGYQAGGLLKLKMQLDHERHAEGKSREQILADIEVELAEIVALSAFIARDLRLDLANGFQSMLESDAAKVQLRGR